MRYLSKGEMGLLLGLVILSLVPSLAGLLRLAELAELVPLGTLPENPRVSTSPSPVVWHIAASIAYCLMGAVQFLPTVRLRHPNWHRRSGRIVWLAGLVAAVSGVWMTHFYSFPVSLQGALLYWVRMLVGLGMISALIVAIWAIRRRDVASHRAFMIRAYALAQGAGTQVFVLLPFTLTMGEPTGVYRDLAMTLAWVINLAIAEWVIHRSPALTPAKIMEIAPQGE